MLTLDEFARAVLFGTTLEEKLTTGELTVGELHPPIETPAFPGRPPSLARVGSAPFPPVPSLGQPSARGRVLHFFANHELLAMELMALVLLKFPNAEPSFRMGLARTIQEEQNHMRLYIARMRELGVDLGELPISEYFWTCMKNVKSPFEFVTQMSLTFEQANLDFSLFYRDEMLRLEDDKTAAVLDRVYREEIGHVKHGLTWFNRWRENADVESDWDAYRRLLPPPLTVRRARGQIFAAAARREAGFSEAFIAELEVAAGSKGRPPVVWFYNPSCDAEIARGKPGFTPPAAVREMTADLAPLLALLASDADYVHVPNPPRLEWLRKLSEAGFEQPQFIDRLELRESKLGGLEPWGWSPESLDRLRPLRDRVLESKQGRGRWCRELLSRAKFEETGFAKFFSKSWSADFLARWLENHPETRAVFGGTEIAGTAFVDQDVALDTLRQRVASGEATAVKAPYGTSGAQVRRVLVPGDLSETFMAWVRKTIEVQGSIVVEPWLRKQHDLSIQLEVHENEIRLFEAREFLVDSQSQYVGTVLGRKIWAESPETLRFFRAALPLWRKLARDVGMALRMGGYLGPAGIDALIYKSASGELRLKPMVELNPRWTMGRVAMALEDRIVPSVPAAWVILRKNAVDLAGIEARFPARWRKRDDGSMRLESGVFFTTDPSTARRVLTALVVGASALADSSWWPNVAARFNARDEGVKKTST